MRGVLLVGLLLSACAPRDPTAPALPPGDYEPRKEDDTLPLPTDRADAMRAGALARARVWREPPQPIGEVDFRRNPPGGNSFSPADEISCKFELRRSYGRTPKFYCILAGGEVLKVKYGHRNPEAVTEVAAARLLSALGFGADLMYAVARVRCFGCPPYPQPRFRWLDAFFSREDRAVDFAPASVERPFPGKKIAAHGAPGWAWYELERIDPGGGANRAERDALRLVAVLLADWDNKAPNQRLVCLPGAEQAGGECREPFAFLQDVGATFGPLALDLEAWRKVPVWADREACRVDMKSLPYHGATFGEAEISEGGRKLLATELKQLRAAQVRDLFAAAGFAQFEAGPDANRDLDGWVRAFEVKVAEVADGPPCPTP